MTPEVYFSGVPNSEVHKGAGATFRENLEREIDHLLEAAPSDACAWSNISRSSVGFEGEMSICSDQGRFSARARGENLEDLSEKLVGQMWMEIKNWRKHR